MLKEVLNTLKPFLDNEQTEEYLSVVSKPFDGKGEKHHILPRSVFPEYAKCEWNLVNLSYKDHYRVHCLLPDMLSGKGRECMLYAWNMMSNRHRAAEDQYASYERFRVELNKIISEAQTGHEWDEDRKQQKRKEMSGSGNHQYGKKAEQSVWFGKVGPNKGRVWSEETRALWSSKRTGSGNVMYGKKHSDETKAKIAATRSGEKNPQYGKTTTDAQKQAAAETCRNRKWTYEERNKISEARRVPVLYEGIVYPSGQSLAKLLGVNKTTVSGWVVRGKAFKLPKNWKELQEYAHLTEYKDSQ